MHENLVVDRDRLRSESANQEKQIEELAAALADKQEALEEVQGLIDESQGVYGLHLNGDLSPWDELLSGCRFERLGSLDHALTLQPHASLVAKIKAEGARSILYRSIERAGYKEQWSFDRDEILDHADRIERGEVK